MISILVLLNKQQLGFTRKWYYGTTFGILATRISTRLLHVYSYGALLFGLILTAIAPSNQDGWLIFLAGRIVTAIAVGLMMPLLQIIIIYMFPIKQRGTAMGLSGLAVGLAPAMGPTLLVGY